MDHDSTPLPARIAPYVLFGASLVALVVRSLYSFCWIDESFYLSLADRLWRGAAPFVDEWHPAQVYAPLLVPFYAAFRAVTGGVTGIVLYFRLLYVGFSCAVALASYLVFKRSFGRFVSCCIALTYLFYLRGNILGMSYYALCTGFFMLGLVFGWAGYQRIRSEVDLGAPSVPRVLLPLASGACFALSIICNPYVIVVFGLACLTGLVYAVATRRARAFMPFLWAMVGAALVACFYLLYLFQLVDPYSIVANLPNVLGSHDENLTLSQRLPNYLSYLPVSRIGFIGTWVLVIFLIFWRVSGRAVTARFRVVVLALDALCLAAACYAAFNSLYPNKVFLAFAEFALPCFLLQEDLRFTLEAHPELHLFWIPGVLLSLVWQFSSNTQISGMLIGFMFACFGAFVTVRQAVPAPAEMKRDTRNEPAAPWLRVLCLVAIAAVACASAYVRLADVYSDCAWDEMSATISDGPAAGLRTSPQHAADYEGVRELLARVNDGGGVWITPMSPWGYLELKGSCAAVSTWNTFMDRDDADVYYEQLGHDKPEWVLVTADDAGDPVNVIAGRTVDFPALDLYHDHTARLREHLAESSEYGVFAETEHGTLYKRAEPAEIRQG